MSASSDKVDELRAEGRRQIEICNACRYCEGFCSVFPAIARQRQFADGDLTQLANLCHNCRACYYACQYTEPHEFALNLPRVLAELRVASWERFAWPAPFARLFQKSGAALGVAMALGLALMLFALRTLRPESGEGFYAHLSHGAMVAIFLPAFILPLIAIGIGLGRYWREVGGGAVTWSHVARAAASAGRLNELSGGQGQGCNFERRDRFTNARRHAHQATLWGFLLCFAATASGTVLHYAGWPAPYGLFSLPKLLGVPGGLLLVAGGVGLLVLKVKADRGLGAPSVWGGEIGFALLLLLTGASGLALYAANGTSLVPALLAFHLGAVLAFFLTAPYSKMAHGFYRFAALLREAQIRETTQR
jgi:citrate/tricarballylate utilization protein